MRKKTFCVKVIRESGRESIIVTGCETLAEAAEAAYRLTQLRQLEFGGTDEFCAAPEE